MAEIAVDDLKRALPDQAIDYGLVWLAEVLRAVGDEASGISP